MTNHSRYSLFSLFLASMLTACGGSEKSEPVPISGECTTNCATAKLIILSWDANPETELVTGYRVYAGVSPDTITTQVANISISDVGFSPENPSITYNLEDANLGISIGDQVCIRVYAENDVGISASSTYSCATIY